MFLGKKMRHLGKGKEMLNTAEIIANMIDILAAM